MTLPLSTTLIFFYLSLSVLLARLNTGEMDGRTEYWPKSTVWVDEFWTPIYHHLSLAR